jgi:superfamily II DNA/RNA helicase
MNTFDTVAVSARTESDLPEAEATNHSPVSFAQLGVPEPVIRALATTGVTSPFPIQSATLGDSLAGRDVLGRGRTGSGKTIAFAVPVVAALAKSAAAGTQRQGNRPRALVLVPTRELANQVTETLAPLAKAMHLKLTTIIGGVGQNPQVSALRNGVDIVVACPGRLEDLIEQGFCRLDRVEVTVLDEADHMADLGFLPAVRRLMDATPRRGQRLLFSATLDNGIDVLVKRFLEHPMIHSVDPEVAPVSTMTHHIFAVSSADKTTVVRELAAGRDRSLLFMRTKHGAKKLALHLTKSGIPAVELHGNLSQNARERNLQSFADGSTKVLVATDIAARGIHVDDIALVVHVDPPAEHKAYLHRSGRTARAGAEGVVITMMTPDQVRDVKDLTRMAKISPVITRVAPGHEAILELVGVAAEYIEPKAPAPAKPATTAARTGQPRNGAPGRGRSGQPKSRDQRGQQAGRASGPRSEARGESRGESRGPGATTQSAPRNPGGPRSGQGAQARPGGPTRSSGPGASSGRASRNSR